MTEYEITEKVSTATVFSALFAGIIASLNFMSSIRRRNKD
jgi:hypothetical protein